MLRKLVSIASTLVGLSALGASWYVDPEATGANNGTSWANAWVGSAAVNWTSVSPGDTVYLSGGTTEKVYLTNFTIGKYGTTGSPISFKLGRDAGHNGKVVFSNAVIGPFDSRPKWINIDGSKSDSFTAPTNWLQVTQGGTAITNNIGIWMRDITSTNGIARTTSPIVWFLRRPDSCNFRWLEISGLTNIGTHQFHQLDGTMCYIDQGSEGSNAATNNVFEYMYIHDNAGQQFVMISGVQTNYDHYTFRYLWMPMNGEDHFEVSGGLTIRDSVIGPQYPNGVHNDMFQLTGNYTKIYNNWIGESQNSWMRIQSLEASRHDIYFFNNLVTEKLGRALGGGVLTEPFCVVHFDPQHPILDVAFSNIVFANNLFYNTVSNTAQGFPELVRNPLLTWSRGAVTNPPSLEGIKWVNNIVVDRHKGVGLPASTNSSAGVALGYKPYTTNDVWVDYNVHAGTNALFTNARKLSWMDQTNIFDAPATYKFANTTNYPLFIDKENDNFELSQLDTVARNTGYNMSSLFTFDSLNRPRGVGGSWDRGPLEAQDTELLTWIRFDDDFSDERLDDSSGKGNHAYRFGRPGSVYPTNWPTQVLASSTPGTNGLFGQYAGDFKWYADGWGLYGRSGDYGAITNVAPFTNLTQATFAVWARYASTKRIDNSYDYSQDGNSTLLSAGTSTGVIGSWDFGRFNQSIWLNNTRFYITTNGNFNVTQVGNGSDPVFGKAGRIVFNYPDNGYTNGDTVIWRHYGFTFSNGVCRTYYQGTNYSSGDISAVTTRLTVGWNNNVSMPFIGIGTDTHGGSPALEDEPAGPDYPNNGWFNGQMDDVRIYSRALTDAEMLTVYNNGVLGGGGGGSPSLGTRFMNARSVRVGVVVSAN